MPDRLETRRQLAQQARLWGLSLICAVVGTVVIVQTDSLATGVSAFLVAVAVLGPLLYLYERGRKHR